MNREQLVKEATAAVCWAIIDDYRKGRLDGVEGRTPEEEMRKRIEKRTGLIADYMRQRLQPQRVTVCAECGMPASTVMGGADYCERHAANHRLALPAGIGAAA